MNALEIDENVRAVLVSVTKETCLQAARRLTELGFSPRVSWQLVESEIGRQLDEQVDL